MKTQFMTVQNPTGAHTTAPTMRTQEWSVSDGTQGCPGNHCLPKFSAGLLVSIPSNELLQAALITFITKHVDRES